MTPRTITTTCCIAGGGPAGLLLGYLLARAGVDVLVLEKHADFLRDFRGDTIHPSTLEVLAELGLLEAFLQLPHQKVTRLRARVGGELVEIADFGALPVTCPFVAFLPQWDFLDFLTSEAARYPGFHLLMRTAVTGLVEEGDRVTGVRAAGPDGPLEIRAALTVGADGRGSTVRASAGLAVRTIGAPIDVLWFRLPRLPGAPAETTAYFDSGQILVQIHRGEYFQCGFVIPKGAAGLLRQEGIARFRERIAAAAPTLRDAAAALGGWDDVKLLEVRVDRLPRWYRPGLLCIGDAAHAMSPVGGVGIHLAVQDAVAAANLLAEPLRTGTLRTDHLARVQRRRELPARVTQRAQVLIQDRVIAPTLRRTAGLRVPSLLRWLSRSSLLRRVPGRLIGMGVLPEHARAAA